MSWSNLILVKKMNQLGAIWIAIIVFHILLEGFMPSLVMFGNLIDEAKSVGKVSICMCNAPMSLWFYVM